MEENKKVYVVAEDLYVDMSEQQVVGVFDTFEGARNCFNKRLDDIRQNYSFIWEEAEKASNVNIDNERAFGIYANEHYYCLRIVEKEMNKCY